eukprot:CAMPEP_0206425376 /NCGR_PEP_ID=MMETSP0324_2-20121206/3756_1 /ASSEMBLY_ACC=CAM_ASM_000836 /TAXON_ID=2866 /ORGANISM="Crypthecodinium cohnii, Strain Seligo" /LENGTH=450 /DNA_ID=CAMNT_0053890149 /DNA_START=312 /DNA_END=1663 /DNA_ORIENTATION=+
MTNNFLTSHILDATMGRSVMQCSHCGSWIGEEEPELEGCRDFLHVYVPLFNFPGEGTDRIPRAFQPRAQLGCMDEMLPSTDHLPRFFDLEDQDPRSPSDVLRLIAPPLDGRSHKGQGGRIGVLGGSVDFVGAPCYAGLSALRVGAELLYLFTADEATGPIKGFSPELMVSGVYSFARMDNAETAASEQDRMVERVAEFLPRLQALVIGPGLGRHPQVLTAVARIIKIVREMKIPLVLDADALYLVQQRPELVRRYPNVILTPNVRELALLTKAFLGREEKDLQGLADNMGSGIVLEKGPVDRIAVGGGDFILECREVGAPRRPGGLGDILAGAVAIIFAWQRQGSRVPASYACLAACTLLRKACEDAFARKKRSMVAPDVIEELGAAFEALCPAEAPPEFPAAASSPDLQRAAASLRLRIGLAAHLAAFAGTRGHFFGVSLSFETFQSCD